MAGEGKAAPGGKIPWPDNMIDANQLYLVIAKELGADNPDPARSHRAYDRALTLEQVVDKARQEGKIKRYVYKDPKTGEPLAYGYNRDDVLRLIGQAPKS
jgi:hypothetical protein